MSERKLVIIKDHGIIPELGSIGGPVLTPTRIPIKTIGCMLTKGRDVWECCPIDPRNEELHVKLTLSNYRDDNFNAGSQKPESADTNETPVEVPETPVEPDAPVEDKKEEDSEEKSPEEPVESVDTNETPAEEAAVEVPETPVEPDAHVEDNKEEPVKEEPKPKQSAKSNKRKK